MDGLFNIFGGGEGAFGDLLGGAGRAGLSGEGLFARLFGLAGDAAEIYWDALAWKYMLGGKGGMGDFRSAWSRMGEGERGRFEQVRDVAKGHSFIGAQLEAYKDKEGIAEILHEYKALGMTLPSAALLTRAYHKLAALLHPDNPDNAALGDALIKELNAGKTALSDRAKRAAYEAMEHENPEGLHQFFTEMGKFNWKKAYDEAARYTRLRIAASPESYKGARKWLASLGAGQQAALAFGVVAAVTLGTYYGVRTLENHRRKRSPQPLVADGGAPSHRARAQNSHAAEAAQTLR